MISSKPDLLDRAVTGRLAGTLCVPGDVKQQWPVRFLAHEPVHNGVWVEPLGESQASLDALIARGATVEVAVCQNHTRQAFRTTIVRRNKHFWLTETMMFNALLLRGPVQLFPAERRAHVRYQVPDGSHIVAQIQCPGAFTPIRLTPWDISSGGVSFLCPREAAVTALKPNDTVQLKIMARGRTIVGRATVRFSRFLTDRVIKAGLKFLPDSMEESSKHQLDQFIADVQRLARPNLIRAAR
jgi:c-di-GMP-binding flagellar brake protein YcgR